MKVRIEKQSKVDEEHAQFNIHEYELLLWLGDIEMLRQQQLERGNQRSQKKLSPTIIYSLPRIDLNN